MFSSQLPKPLHTGLESVKVVIPKDNAKSSALIVPESRFKDTEDSDLENVEELQLLRSQDYARVIIQKSGGPKNAQASLEDTIPLKIKYPNLKHHFPRYTLENCPDSSLRTCLEGTREVIQRLLAQQQGAEEDIPKNDVFEYKPPSLNDEDMGGRTVQVTTLQEDPMLPPKHKLRKNRHEDPSPPPPILRKAPTEKITKETKDKWAIPSVVSNWSNSKGYSISLRKRQEAASGGQISEHADINAEKFSLLALALETADQNAREEIRIRNEERRVMAQREQEEKERRLKELVNRTRDERKRPRFS